MIKNKRVNKKSNARLKPTSLYPLKPEETLKDLLNTPFKIKRKKKSIEVEKKKN